MSFLVAPLGVQNGVLHVYASDGQLLAARERNARSSGNDLDRGGPLALNLEYFTFYMEAAV